MKYELRDYQKEASDKAVGFFLNKEVKHNALMVLGTGAGKSLIIADIAYRLDENVLILCPQKEILQQNYEKMRSYGVECSMYSASVGVKEISKITFATIGSVKNIVEEFKDYEYIMVDECHLCNPKKGMYKKFFKELKKKVLGLTATPYRLEGIGEYDYKTKEFKPTGSYLQMLTDYARPIFKEIIYNVDTRLLADRGYLCRPDYWVMTPKDWDNGKMRKNTAGSDYADYSVQWMQKITDFKEHAQNILHRLIDSGRNGILMFVRFIEDAEYYKSRIKGSEIVTGDMIKKEREDIMKRFTDGDISVLINVKVLTTGFDYPALDAIVLAAPTMSLALYSQEVGRCVRPYKGKKPMVIDLVNNYSKFGDTFDQELVEDNGKWYIANHGQRLTGVML